MDQADGTTSTKGILPPSELDGESQVGGVAELDIRDYYYYPPKQILKEDPNRFSVVSNSRPSLPLSLLLSEKMEQESKDSGEYDWQEDRPCTEVRKKMMTQTDLMKALEAAHPRNSETAKNIEDKTIKEGVEEEVRLTTKNSLEKLASLVNENLYLLHAEDEKQNGLAGGRKVRTVDPGGMSVMEDQDSRLEESHDIAVVPVDYPESHLTSQLAEAAAALITKKILSLPSADGISPKFYGYTHKKGAMILHCQDDETKAWVEVICKKLILRDVPLMAIDSDDLRGKTECAGYFPQIHGLSMSPQEMLEVLDLQNQGLGIQKWSVDEQHTDNRGWLVIFSIPESHIGTLKERKFLLNYSLFRVELWPYPGRPPDHTGADDDGAPIWRPQATSEPELLSDLESMKRLLLKRDKEDLKDELASAQERLRRAELEGKAAAAGLSLQALMELDPDELAVVNRIVGRELPDPQDIVRLDKIIEKRRERLKVKPI